MLTIIKTLRSMSANSLAALLDCTSYSANVVLAVAQYFPLQSGLSLCFALGKDILFSWNLLRLNEELFELLHKHKSIGAYLLSCTRR